MAYFRNQNVKGLFIAWVCCLLHIIMIKVIPGEAVAPNSPTKLARDSCPSYKYQDKSDKGVHKCRRCSQCPKGFQMKTKCNMNNDTVCEQCISGWYNDVSGSRCKPCSECKAGQYIRRECSVKRNTICRPCPRYMFSVNSNSTRCLQCKTCKRNEERLSKCNSTVDTVCGDCKKDHFRVSSTGSCLLCSRCPLQYQSVVVPECRNKRGFDNPDICWPGSTEVRLTDSNELSRLKDDNIVEIVHSDKDIPDTAIIFPMVISVSGTFLAGILFLLFAFICVRHLYPMRNYSSNTTDDFSSFPLSPVIQNTSERLCHSFDLTGCENSSQHYILLSTVDQNFENSIEELNFFKRLKPPSQHCHKMKYMKDVTSGRSQSVPIVSETPVTSLQFNNETGQRFETSDYPTYDIHYTNNKKHETL